MIPHEFEYTAPATLKEALALIADGDRKILAGGQSLIPLMKLRLAQPGSVVDLARVPGLNQISESGGIVHIGALATHHDIEAAPVIRAHCPLLGETASHIGDPQVRHMGTIGGSIAHADPAADYPAAFLPLEAQIHIVSATTDRTVSAADFFVDAFTTALDPGEIVLDIAIPAESADEGYCYEKVPHPASGFAVVGIAVRLKKSGSKMTMARVAVTGLASRAFRATSVERLLESGASIPDSVVPLAEGQQPNSDLYASADYRVHLARIHAQRALTSATSRLS
jgi:aerobic carbon-monoxide dehydrogenase medium subunit